MRGCGGRCGRAATAVGFGGRVATLDGAAVTGGELPKLALVAVGRSDDSDPARTFDAFPTGGGKAERRELGCATVAPDHTAMSR